MPFARALAKRSCFGLDRAGIQTPSVALTLLSLFQTFGAIVGIITGCVVLGDRWMKQRPYAVLVGHSPEGWMRRRYWFRITNPSSFPIIVEARPERDAFRAGKDEEIRSAIAAAMGATTTFMIDAGADRLFIAYEPDGFEDMPTNRRFTTTLRWRRAQAGRCSLARGRMKVSILKGNAELLLGDRDQFPDEDR